MSGGRRSGFDKLVYVQPQTPLDNDGSTETVDDLERIMALPRRAPFNCQRDPLTKRYPPATQALIELVTSRFTVGERLSCACRPRKVVRRPDGTLLITRVLPADYPPEAPVVTTVDAFIADCRKIIAAASADTARKIIALRPGDEIDLPAADGEGHPCITTFNATQSWILYEAQICGGVVAFAGAGSGKTIAWMIAPLLFPDARLAVVLIEPKQRKHYRSHYYRLREHFRVPSVVFDDGGGEIVPGTTPTHLISYSVLSQTKNSDLLDERDPDTLILDECHRATGRSGINRRVKRFAADKIIRREEALAAGQKVRARALNLLDGSGTLEAKSVGDTQMLCAYSLGTGSPLPLDPRIADAFSAVMDVSRNPDYVSKTAQGLYRAFANRDAPGKNDSLDNMLAFAPEKDVRKGFQKRRSETLGIITATTADVNASIYISERVPPKMPKEIREALAMARSGKRPDGDLLVEKLDQVVCARHIGVGFYNYWSFEKHPCTCGAAAGAEVTIRCDNCLLIENWYDKRKNFHKELRTTLNAGEKFLDTQKLCIDAAKRAYQDPPYEGKMPIWQCATWPEWRDIENKVEHEERVRWISDWLAQDAADWATSNKGIVWFSSTPFGRRVAELAGIPYFNGGPGCEDRLRAEKGNRSIVCSIPALGAGTDGLQNIFSEQLIAETPSSNANSRGLEQLLARLHRQGQKADTVKTQMYVHISELLDALRKAVSEAEFNYEMTGNVQKLLFADIEIDL